MEISHHLRLAGRPVPREAVLLGSALAPLAVAALLSPFRESLAPAASVLVLVLLVVAIAATGDRLAGLTAAASAGVFFDAFLTRPYGTLAISDPDDVEAFVLLLLVGVAVTELALWGRRHEARAGRTRGYLDGVLAAAEAGAGADATVVRVVTTQVAEVLGLDGCVWVPSHDGAAAHRTVVQPDGTVTRAGRPVDVVRHGLPVDEEVVLPVRSGGAVVGMLLLTAATRVRRPTPEQLRVAVLLADQLGRATTSSTEV